ncbi:ABC transporter permease subunit [Peribacillus acanthi]|uniref:ABC transporter permease subunit n=1 Tax=Peribacillus acanthi TaxID=2171554 RepID=UPI000D3E0606|nr:ABC transporter permease subunit [Peribacillus acanthi]
MNIFLHEIKAYQKSTFVWTASLVLILILFMSMFPSITKEIVGFKKLLEGFPEGVRKSLGIQIESIGSLIGFYSYAFTYITLCGAIQGMNLGVSIISKETREKTADFLFTKPVRRSYILYNKFLAAVISILITNVFYLIAANIIANIVKIENYNTTIFLLISFTLLFIQLIFLSIGILIALVFPKVKSVITISLGIVFMFFIIGMIASSDGKDIGRYFSPFKYFDSSYIVQNSSYETSFLVTGIAVIIVSVVTSFIIYLKRDIQTV